MEERWIYNIRKNLSTHMESKADWVTLTNHFDKSRVQLILGKIANTIIKKDGIVIFDRISKEYFEILIEEIKASEMEFAKKQYQLDFFIAECAQDDEMAISDYAISRFNDLLSQREEFANWLNSVANSLAANLPDTATKNKNTNQITQPQPEEQITTQKDLHYYCQKAIEKGYLAKLDGGYRRVMWSKAQLAYFLGHFKKIDGTFPDIEYCNMFGENRLSKALGQLINNKTGYGKPKGYEIVDNILQE